MQQHLYTFTSTFKTMNEKMLFAALMSAHLKNALAANETDFEVVTGPLIDHLLDSLCALRALAAARSQHQLTEESTREAGDALIRLTDQLEKIWHSVIHRPKITLPCPKLPQ